MAKRKRGMLSSRTQCFKKLPNTKFQLLPLAIATGHQSSYGGQETNDTRASTTIIDSSKKLPITKFQLSSFTIATGYQSSYEGQETNKYNNELT